MSTGKIKWVTDATGASVLASNDAPCGRVVIDGCTWSAYVWLEDGWLYLGDSASLEDARERVETFWRDVAVTARGLGL